MTGLILENVSVEFPVYGAARSIRRAAFERTIGGRIAKDQSGHERALVKALEGVSFCLVEGDRLGLVGHNGAGKSTVLKVAAGVYEPVVGRVLSSGPVTSLLEVMPGLDLEDNGYENIVTAGLLLGMTRSEVEGRIPDIEQFSELGEYLALPVRTYSAGMLTRLGFAVATAVNPLILVMDEGLGAGDARFAERASVRMRRLIDRSRILIIASHDNSLIRAWCNKAALLEGGKLLMIGGVEEVLDRYSAATLR